MRPIPVFKIYRVILMPYLAWMIDLSSLCLLKALKVRSEQKPVQINIYLIIYLSNR